MEIPGENTLVLSNAWDSPAGFKYYGSSLEQGHCGVLIQQVKSVNHGQVKCFLGIQGAELQGSANLTVACEYTFFFTV